MKNIIEKIFITDAKNKIKYLSNEIQSLNEKGFNFLRILKKHKKIHHKLEKLEDQQ